MTFPATASERPRELFIERVFDAPRELVFEVWTRPEHLVNWWGPNEFTLPHCTADFRVGGAFRFCMRSPDGVNYWVSGRYQKIREPESIAFSWVREDEAGKIWCRTNVTVTFEEEDGGKTRFRLHQKLFESIEYCEQHRGGWTQCIDRLSDYVRELAADNNSTIGDRK